MYSNMNYESKRVTRIKNLVIRKPGNNPVNKKHTMNKYARMRGK